MLKTLSRKMAAVAIAASTTVFSFAPFSVAQGNPSASVAGKYRNLLQVLECAADLGSYGSFNDYGYWGGGSWCGSYGQAGYWVYDYPNWYIWGSESTTVPVNNVPAIASVNGKYSNLIQVLSCEEDQGSYGNFSDYGYWGGGSWCGDVGAAGHWVYVYPNWYIWGDEN